MNEKILTGATLAEFESMNNRAKRIWIGKELGVKPTKKSVKKVISNPSPINLLEWVAILVLVVLIAWTGFKVFALAIPFSDATLEILGDHAQFADWVKTAFTLLTGTLFVLLSTPAVLYFKVLSHDDRTLEEIKKHPAKHWYSVFSLEYLTPRLPAWVVYISIGWLVYLSTQLKGSAFELYLPVIVEIALAQLVGELLDKSMNYNKLITQAFESKLKTYENREAAYEKDSTFLKVLYMVMVEDMAKLQRRNLNTNRVVKPNAWLGEANSHEVYSAISSEYQRHTTGNKFAEDVLNPQTPQPVLEAEVRSTRILPPNGGVWTPETLLSSLLERGITGSDGYDEGKLNADYDGVGKPRAAWRGNGFKVAARDLLAQH